ncbi:hypothetical protein PG991_009165, partial [Apiospora marii]
FSTGTSINTDNPITILNAPLVFHSPGMTRKREYYAVLRGRVERPTIFSSWSVCTVLGDAHPRVTGCKARHKAFHTIEEAREQMTEWGVPKDEYAEILKNGAGETTPLHGCEAFYAVAHGKRPGIYSYWDETKLETEKISGVCHKHFRTRAQAEAFIEDWKQSYTEVYAMVLKQALDQDLRPRDLKMNLEDILEKPEAAAENKNCVDSLKMSLLDIKGE